MGDCSPLVVPRFLGSTIFVCDSGDDGDGENGDCDHNEDDYDLDDKMLTMMN